MGKIIGIIVIVVIVLVVIILAVMPSVATWFVNNRSDRFVNAEVTLDDIDLNLLRGRLTVEGLHVGQPEGFEGDALFDLARLHVDFSMASLFNPPLVVGAIEVEQPAVHVIKDSNGVMNVASLVKAPPAREPAVEPVPAVAEAEPEGEPATPPAVTLLRLQVDGLTARYEDHSLGDEPVDVTLGDLMLLLQDVRFDVAGAGEPILPGSMDMTARIMRDGLPDARLGAAARIGVLGTNVPAVNAVLRLSGFELASIGEMLVPGIAQVLGGSSLDVYADAIVSPDVLDVDARLVTAGTSLGISVGGTLDSPEVNLGAIAGLLASRVGDAALGAVGNVGAAGGQAALAAGETALAVGKGAGKIVGAMGSGLFGALKGAATGDLGAIGDGLKQTTVGAVGEAVSAVTNATMTAADGLGDAAGATIGMDTAAKWREETDTRWEDEWTSARKALGSLPYPRPPEVPEVESAEAAETAEAAGAPAETVEVEPGIAPETDVPGAGSHAEEAAAQFAGESEVSDQ